MTAFRIGGERISKVGEGVEVTASATDGSKTVTVLVSREALEDLEGAQSLQGAELLSAFAKHRAPIMRAVSQAAELAEHGATVVLRSRDVA